MRVGAKIVPVKKPLEKILQEVAGVSQAKALMQDDQKLTDVMRSLHQPLLKDYLPELFGLVQKLGSMSTQVVTNILREGGERTLHFIQVLFRMGVFSVFDHLMLLTMIVDGWDKKWMRELKPDVLGFCREDLEGREAGNHTDSLRDHVRLLALFYKNQELTKQEIRLLVQSFNPPYKCRKFSVQESPDYIADAVELETFLDRPDDVDRLTHFQLRELVSVRRVKEERVAALVEKLGFSRLKDHIGELLEFVQDDCWPNAEEAIRILREGGRDAVPEIQKVFRQYADDEIWCHWVITHVISQLNAEVIAALKEEILHVCNQLLNSELKYEMHQDRPQMVREILTIFYTKKTMTKKELLSYFQSIRARFKEDVSDNEWIQAIEDQGS